MAWKNIKARRKYDLEYKRQKQLDMSPEELLEYRATKRGVLKLVNYLVNYYTFSEPNTL